MDYMPLTQNFTRLEHRAIPNANAHMWTSEISTQVPSPLQASSSAYLMPPLFKTSLQNSHSHGVSIQPKCFHIKMLDLLL